MEKLLQLLVKRAKLQQGYEDIAENAKRMEQWQLHDEHIESALLQKKEVDNLIKEILNLVK